MGNSGSKSVVRNGTTVKEQRVDGSWHVWLSPCLRCTLMGFERNYQVKILSNRINKPWLLQGRSYTSASQQCLTQNLTMNPWFVTGFADAESCFALSVIKNNKMKAGWHVKLSFQIGLHQKDHALLEQIKTYLGVGNIYKQGSQLLQFRVDSVKDLKVIINHFDKYSLITKKLVDYNLFKLAYNKQRTSNTGGFIQISSYQRFT